MARHPVRPSRPGSDGTPLEVSLPLPSPLEELASPAWQLDRKGAVVGANRRAREIEAEAGTPLPLFTPGHRQILAESTELSRALAEGRRLEVCIRGANRPAPLRLSLEPLLGDGGSPDGALLIAHEPTRAGRSRSLLGRILGTAAHELSAPLTPLATFVSLARRAADDGDAARAAVYLERIQRYTHRVDCLAAEMRELQEVMAGRLELRNQAFDLAEVVRQSVDRALCWSGDHVYRIDAPGEAVVIGDGERIARVIDELLSNAARFSPLGSAITVGLLLAGRAVTLSVADAGDGFPEDRLADLLDGPCWDREAPRNGLGLGLYLAREVIERHGGTIRAERCGDGGTRVVVELPRVCRD